MTLIAKTRGFTYPADADSLARIRAAGGLSRMTEAERATVRLKSVPIGGDCSDMPTEAAVLYLSRGDIERVAAAKKGKA